MSDCYICTRCGFLADDQPMTHYLDDVPCCASCYGRPWLQPPGEIHEELRELSEPPASLTQTVTLRTPPVVMVYLDTVEQATTGYLQTLDNTPSGVTITWRQGIDVYGPIRASGRREP